MLDAAGLLRPWSEPPLPDEPSLVVMPFDSLGGDPHFALGLAEDLTTELLGVPGLLVISRNSAMAYAGGGYDIAQVGQALGVRYAVEGTVRREGDRVRVTTQLTDATSRRQLWSQRYDRVLSDILTLQSEISEQVLGALNLKISDAELLRIRGKPTRSLSAYEAVKHASGDFIRFTREGNRRARALCERALELDPEYAAAWALLANTYNYEYMSGWNQDPALLNQAEAQVRRALELEPQAPGALASATALHIARRHWSEAVASGERAVALAPSYDFAHFLLAMAYRGEGRPLAALQTFQRGLRLDPRGQAPVLAFMADLNLGVGRHEEAVAIWERIRAENPDHIASRLDLADQHLRSGREAQTRALLEEILRINPAFSLERARGPGGRPIPAETVGRLAPLLERARSASLRSSSGR
jgi:TolB-like protein